MSTSSDSDSDSDVARDRARSRCVRRRTGRMLLRRRSGTELLELGLVAFPILLTMVFGTIEFGTYFYVENNLQAAAREGARAGVVAPADQRDEAILAAVERVFSESSLNKMDGFSYDDPIIEVQDSYLQVTVRTTWNRVPEGLRPMLLIRHPEQAELKGFAAMRIESNTLTP
jgi:Flp pilus assembly protein TadG